MRIGRKAGHDKPSTVTCGGCIKHPCKQVRFHSGCQASGVYGDSCKERCPANCRDNVCHIQKGNCFGCSPGWMDTICNRSMITFYLNWSWLFWSFISFYRLYSILMILHLWHLNIPSLFATACTIYVLFICKSTTSVFLKKGKVWFVIEEKKNICFNFYMYFSIFCFSNEFEENLIDISRLSIEMLLITY